MKGLYLGGAQELAKRDLSTKGVKAELVDRLTSAIAADASRSDPPEPAKPEPAEPEPAKPEPTKPESATSIAQVSCQFRDGIVTSHPNAMPGCVVLLQSASACNGPSPAGAIDSAPGNSSGAAEEPDAAEGTCHDCSSVGGGWKDETNGNFYCEACWDRFGTSTAEGDVSEADDEEVGAGLKRKRDDEAGEEERGEDEGSDEEAAAEAAQQRRILQELAGGPITYNIRRLYPTMHPVRSRGAGRSAIPTKYTIQARRTASCASSLACSAGPYVIDWMHHTALTRHCNAVLCTEHCITLPCTDRTVWGAMRDKSLDAI